MYLKSRRLFYTTMFIIDNVNRKTWIVRIMTSYMDNIMTVQSDCFIEDYHTITVILTNMILLQYYHKFIDDWDSIMVVNSPSIAEAIHIPCCSQQAITVTTVTFVVDFLTTNSIPNCFEVSTKSMSSRWTDM